MRNRGQTQDGMEIEKGEENGVGRAEKVGCHIRKRLLKHSSDLPPSFGRGLRYSVPELPPDIISIVSYLFTWKLPATSKGRPRSAVAPLRVSTAFPSDGRHYPGIEWGKSCLAGDGPATSCSFLITGIIKVQAVMSYLVPQLRLWGTSCGTPLTTGAVELC